MKTMEINQSDARALATNWENVIELLDYPTLRVVVVVCMAVASAYCRAFGVRLGSRPTLGKLASVSIVAATMQEAVEARPSFYPALQAVGVDDSRAWHDMVTGWKERRLETREKGLPFEVDLDEI